MDDGGTFDVFARREYGRLVRALTLYCRDGRVAEELTQDAFVRAYQRWGRVAGLDRPDAWLHRVAFNLARSWWRRRLAEQRAYARHGPDSPVESGPSGAMSLSVREAVAGLPPRQREVVVLRFFLQHTATETAELLDITPNAVAAATFKAVRSLRDVLDVDVDITQEVDHA